MFILTLPTQEYAPPYRPGERVTNVLMLVTKKESGDYQEQWQRL